MRASGKLTIEAFNPRSSLAVEAANPVLHGDGSTIIIHRDADDHESRPARAEAS